MRNFYLFLALSVALGLSACFDAAAPTDDTAPAEVVDSGEPADLTQATDTPDVPAIIDTAKLEAVTADTAGAETAAATCPGGAGCPCKDNFDCDIALCIVTPNGKQCGQKCIDTCPTDFKCVLVDAGAGDLTNVCVPKAGHLCDPCGANKDCASLGIVSPVCVNLGAEGSFCGIDCTTTGDCPVGYNCGEATSIEGSKTKQCLRAPDTAKPNQPGVCPCSAFAMAQTRKTTCYTESKDGTGKVIGKCGGSRLCGSSGLTLCTSPSASAEVCNGKDDDCDGATDESACDDNNPCTADPCDPTKGPTDGCTHPIVSGPCDADGSLCTDGDSCAAGKCLAGKSKACDDSNPCTKDSCASATGCVATPDDGAPCDDENPCSVGDACQASKCVSGPAKSCASTDVCVNGKCSLTDGKCKFSDKPDGLPCNDGTVCTKSDACKLGNCVGTVASCDDGNPCSDDGCDAVAGCLYTNNNLPCSDGNGCTVGDTCTAGVCKSGVAKLCDDGNPCTADACSASSAGCVFKPVTVTCSDGDACTPNDLCADGGCKPGVPKDCNDKNPCTVDTCDAGTGNCTTTPSASTCDDDDACTVGDSCSSGQCNAGPPKLCADSDTCTADQCNGASGKCSFTVIIGCGGNCAKAADCDDKNACTANPCQSSKCAFGPTTDPCDDSNPCSVGDACAAGSCKSGPTKDCDDGNPCTDDSCNSVDGSCKHPANSAPCSDGDACTNPDICGGSACKPGATQACNDGNPCTDDGCDAASGVCTKIANTKPCTDSNACTTNDLCGGGACKSGAAVNCDDTNPCTTDGCDTATGQCTAIPNTVSCDDNNACTQGDICANSVCKSGALKVCDDSNVCSDDACSPSSGQCSHSPNSAACTDSDLCTPKDTCANSTCVPGAKVTCDDSDACTSDSCVTTSGKCAFALIVGCGGNCAKAGDCDDKNLCTDNGCTAGKCEFSANLSTCSDGNGCTLNDLCTAGACKPGIAKVCDDKKACTTDSCDMASGACINANNTDNCDDSNPCTAGDVCSGGACVPGKPVVCDDSNVCTSDACDGSTGKCVVTANTAECSDGDPCTLNDACALAKCAPGAAKNCSDGNPCSNDACDPSTGACKNVATTDPCSDGNACTIGDICAALTCKAGALKVCDDSNVCTNDTCNAVTGQCAFAANSGSCTDSNPCTLVDVCSASACKPGTAKLCNDSDACTSDACDPATGNCVFKPIVGCGGNCAISSDCSDSNVCTDDNCTAGKCAFPTNTTSCSDGNGCTLSDVCAGGVCKGGAAKVCDDSNPCTTDSCTAAAGVCNNLNNNANCTDNDACTSGDKCSSGACKPGLAKNCDDANACTTDGCDAATAACTKTPNSDPCNDGDACTLSDVCANSACSAGKPLVCVDDGDPCTYELCAPATGLCSIAGGQFVTVPASVNYGTAPFCVAKYEMKIVGFDDGGATAPSNAKAEARISGTPWLNTSTADAANRCGAIGPGFRLITATQ